MTSGKPLAIGIASSFFALAGWAALRAAPAPSPRLAPPVVSPAAPLSPDAVTFFETRIRPLLAENCFACHGEKAQQGGVRLDTAVGFRKGSDNGPLLSPDTPEHSRLLRVLSYADAIKMPPGGKLKPEQIADLTAWVKRGAPWPEQAARGAGKKAGGKQTREADRAKADAKGQDQTAASSPDKSGFPYPAEKRRFWSFLPVKNPPLPAVKNTAWARSPLDRFVLAKLEAAGLHPAPPADRRTLIRRASFDLIGLPPTPEAVAAFVADKSPNAWAKVIDGLLASPHYGERWGRHWLDVVRYADSLDARGLGSEGDISEAWRYRDWVVAAFNSDLPYNQFVMNQIAGDLLPPTDPNVSARLPKANSPNPPDINVPGTIATGLLAIGEWGNGDADKDKILTDIADDQVDVVSRAFMGLTVACARCHDHKFDPIPTRDYYGLAGIFFSTHILPKLTPKGAGEAPLRIPLLTNADKARREAWQAQTRDVEKRLAEARSRAAGDLARSLLPQTAQYMTAAWEYAQRSDPPRGETLESWAKARGLQSWALRQWQQALGLQDYALLNQYVPNVLNDPNVSAFRGSADTPVLTVNANAVPRKLQTFTLAAKSVAVHPGPASGIAVGWRSPVTTTVRLAGRVSDDDPADGDGIAWVLQKRTRAGAVELASGGFDNGGAQAFSESKTGAGALDAIAVRAGDELQLIVLPKANYICDTTNVEWTLTDTAGGSSWNLAQDIVADLHGSGGNPHGDRFGHAATWRFYESPILPYGADNPGIGSDPSALARWRQRVEAAPDGLAGLDAVRQASEAFARACVQPERHSPFALQRDEDESVLPATARVEIARLRAERDALKKAPPPPVSFANGAQEGGVPESPHAGLHDVPIHIRGSYARLGELVPRHFPVVLGGDRQPPIPSGSGRLQLAQWIASPSHPLTARVIVNRIWQHHFGEGIVRTTNNFGALGEFPTHPELLDALAFAFTKPVGASPLACNWSLKRLHRLLMLSATYQQSSDASPQTIKADPDNRLLGHMNRRRLEAEAVRDNLLATAGKLDPTPGGPAVRDFDTPRRSLYVMTIRSERTGFGPLFDVANPGAIVERRAVSTVAPQSLFLLNSPFALDLARTLAARLAREAPAGDQARIQRAYQLLYARPALPAEEAIGLRYLAHMRQSNPRTAAALPAVRTASAPPPSSAPDTVRTEARAWEAYCQVLLCANEFIYVD